MTFREPLEHVAIKAAIDIGVPVAALRGPSRRRELVIQRYEAMRRCRAAGYKVRAIADYFNRHHSIVVYAIDPDKAMVKRAKMRKRLEVQASIKRLQVEHDTLR